MCTCTRVYELHIRIYYHNIYTYMSTFSQVGCLAPISPSDICQVSAPSPIRVLRPPLRLVGYHQRHEIVDVYWMEIIETQYLNAPVLRTYT